MLCGHPSLLAKVQWLRGLSHSIRFPILEQSVSQEQEALSLCNSLLGLSLLKEATPGIKAVSVIIEAFMTAKIPLAASLWPMFGLTYVSVSV